MRLIGRHSAPALVFADRFGVAVDRESLGYADLWLRGRYPTLPPPDLRLWYRKGLWVPLSCVVSIVNHAAAQTPTGSGGTGAITAAKDITGATLVVAAVVTNDAQTTPTDNVPNTFVPITAQTAIIFSQVYYVKNPTTSAAYVVTAANTNRFVSVTYAAFSGTDTTANVDQSTSASNTGITPGSITPSVDNEVVVTCSAGNDPSGKSAPTGYTLADFVAFISSQAYSCGLAYKVQTTATATNPAWTYNAESVTHAHIASFKASSGVASRGLFRTPGVTGIGSGGSFFRDPLQAARH